MTAEPGQQTIAILILLNISRSKDNEKPYTKCGEEAIPRAFSKKSKLSISPDKKFKVLCRSLAFNSYKAFLKNKKKPGTSIPATFSA